MLDADPAPMLLDYKRGMEEICLRLDSVALQHNDVAATGTIEAPVSRFRLETGFMHLRKVLELIAFSSLIAHNDVYVAAYKNKGLITRSKSDKSFVYCLVRKGGVRYRRSGPCSPVSPRPVSD